MGKPSKKYLGDKDRAATESEITTTIIQSWALGIFNWMSLDELFNSGVFCFLNSKLEMKIPSCLPQSLWEK